MWQTGSSPANHVGEVGQTAFRGSEEYAKAIDGNLSNLENPCSGKPSAGRSL